MQTPQPSTFTIFRGDTKVMSLKALYAETFDPLDLTDCTEIDVALPNADGTFDHKRLSVGAVFITDPAILGKFTVPISSVSSALLNLGEFQGVDVTFTIGAETITVRYFQALSVFERN